MKKSIGVVVLNFNSHDLTIRLAEELARMTSVDHICVVDNCSKDSFDEDFHNEKIHYIKNVRNAGYAAGNNIGLRYLVNEKGCDYVFISNPDVYFEEDALIKMCDTFDENPKVALLTTKRFGQDHAVIHQYHKFPTFKFAFFRNFLLLGRLNITESYEVQNTKVDKASNYLVVDAVPGAFFGMRSSFLIEIGFLFEGTFLYCEEIILGQQAKRLGYEAVVINSATHIHDHYIAHFSNKKMYALDRESMMIYFKKFNLLSRTETAILKLAIKFGCFEYGIACSLYKLIKR